MNAIDKLIKEIKLWQPKDISYTKLVGGLSNENYLIHDARTNKKYALKMPPTKGSLADRGAEILVHQKCSEIALSPQLLYVTAEKAFVTAYIEGESLTPEMIRKAPTLLKKCMGAAKQLHSQIKVEHNNYAFDFVRMMLHVKEENMYDKVKDYKEMLRISTEIEQAIGFDKRELCTTHNDLKPANFIVDRRGKCWLIDFEWSGNNELEFDLAKFSLFTEISEEKVVQTYFEEANEAQLGKVFLYKMLNSLLVVQWCAVQQQVSTLGLNEELYELGNKHLGLFFSAYNNRDYRYYRRIVSNLK